MFAGIAMKGRANGKSDTHLNLDTLSGEVKWENRQFGRYFQG